MDGTRFPASSPAATSKAPSCSPTTALSLVPSPFNGICQPLLISSQVWIGQTDDGSCTSPDLVKLAFSCCWNFRGHQISCYLTCFNFESTKLLPNDGGITRPIIVNFVGKTFLVVRRVLVGQSDDDRCASTNFVQWRFKRVVFRRELVFWLASFTAMPDPVSPSVKMALQASPTPAPWRFKPADLRSEAIIWPASLTAIPKPVSLSVRIADKRVIQVSVAYEASITVTAGTNTQILWDRCGDDCGRAKNEEGNAPCHRREVYVGWWMRRI